MDHSEVLGKSQADSSQQSDQDFTHQWIRKTIDGYGDKVESGTKPLLDDANLEYLLLQQIKYDDLVATLEQVATEIEAAHTAWQQHFTGPVPEFLQAILDISKKAVADAKLTNFSQDQASGTSTTPPGQAAPAAKNGTQEQGEANAEAPSASHKNSGAQETEA